MSTKPELLVVPQKWEIVYEYSAGKTASRFLTELRDNARILAKKCNQCGRILLPPRSFCEKCFVSLDAEDQWVELEPAGELRAYTIVTAKFAGQPKPPYVLCYVTIGGSTTTIPQFLTGIDLSDIDKAKKELKVGMSVRVVFKDKARRQARMTDFTVELAR